MANGLDSIHGHAQRAAAAYHDLAGEPDHVLQNNAVFAMGILLGGGFPYSHATVVKLYERAWPEKAAALRIMLGLGEV